MQTSLALRPSQHFFSHVGTFSWVKQVLMPSLHLAYDELTAPVRCLNSHFREASVRRQYDIVRFHGRRRVAVASTILFNSALYKNRKPAARRMVVEASHDPRTGTARWPHADCAEIARFKVVLDKKNRTMIVGSLDNRTAPARLSQSRRTVPVQCPYHHTDI